MADAKEKPALVLPVGTQVVMTVEIHDPAGTAIRRSGTVGKIIESPSDNSKPYRVIFPDGETSELYRQDLAIRKQLQSLTFDRPDALPGDEDLYKYVIYKCVVGSRAFGLDVDDSDIDRRGIYLPTAELHWSLYGIPEQIEKADTQECYWELQKFLVLALKANPNVLECLYTPLVEHKNEIAEELLAGRTKFLSRLVYQTYNGYVLSQFRKLEQDLRTRGELRWKHVMHLVRLLVSGTVILKDGFVPVRVEQYRDRFMEIRSGNVEWDKVNEWRLQLHKEFDAAFASTKLPERPDYEWSNDFLISARRRMVSS